MHAVASHQADTLLDLLPDAVIKADANWDIVYFNAAAVSVISPDEAGQSLWKAFLDSADRTLQNIVPPATLSFSTASGESYDIRILESPDSCRVLQFRNVTEMRRTEEKLHEEIRQRAEAEHRLEAKQEFIEAVLDSIGSGIVACDENGTLSLFNRATRVFHGVSESPLPPEEWASHYDLYYPDGVTPLRKEDIPLFRAFSGEVVRNAEMVIAPKNGPRRSLLASGRSMTGRGGRKLGAVIAMDDISHRKISSQRVRDALRHFRTLFNDAPLAYHEIDCDGIIRRVNRAECRLLGRSREELVGRPAWDFVAPHQRESSRRSVFEKISGARPLAPFEREFAAADGRIIVAELHENHILDRSGAITGIRTAVLDITDRKRHQAQEDILIREKAARELAETASAEIKSILERIGDAYMTFDEEWRYTYVNRRAAELALKPASELVGRCVWDEFPASVGTRFYTELQRSMREQVVVEFENYFAPLGKWFENTVYPSPSGVAVFYRDVTDRKRTHHSLEKRTIELARKNAELEAFAYMASHDLQEPLRMVGTYTGLLAKTYERKLGEEADEYIRFTLDGIERMQRLVQDLLALCQMDNLDTARLATVDVSSALGIALENLEGSIRATGAIVEGRDLPLVTAIESHMVQLLQNLIGNAIKYCRTTPQVIVSAVKEQGRWLFSVQDNGIGFHMRHSEQVFQPFKRLHRGTGGGSGIGLAICKKIVENRGGCIWVNSAPGSGSTFFFTIPDEIPGSE